MVWRYMKTGSAGSCAAKNSAARVFTHSQDGGPGCESCSEAQESSSKPWVNPKVGDRCAFALTRAVL